MWKKTDNDADNITTANKNPEFSNKTPVWYPPQLMSKKRILSKARLELENKQQMSMIS